MAGPLAPGTGNRVRVMGDLATLTSGISSLFRSSLGHFSRRLLRSFVQIVNISVIRPELIIIKMIFYFYFLFFIKRERLA